MARLILALFLAVQLYAVDFARDIRPILSDRCFSCHGPDEANRKAGMRLDTEEGAARASAKILGRIQPDNPARRMPPPYSDRKPLTAAEIATVRAWLDQGAKWQSHWSFTPPVRPQTPAAGNPIDGFILARLQREGLAASKEADRARLLRRVTFDLTGLPPTLAQLDAFLADRAPNAYEKVVDRLLASPQYGERMAVDWLDLARYADTHGYQVDPEKEMWPWRDWVVNAFNRNMPYDQFTIEQLAGDLLPNATLDQKIATGFQRNHRINSETGSIAEEFHAENLVDRVSTFGTVWLGLTVGCARCHDHKYDPLPTKDFYSLFAFFNSVEEAGNGGTRDARGNFKPFLRLPAPELEAQLAAKDKELVSARERLAEVEKELASRSLIWATPQWQVLKPADLKAEGSVELRRLPDGSVLATGPKPATSMYEFTAETSLQNITAFRLELIPDASLPGGGSGRGTDGKGVVTLFEVRRDDKKVDLTRITADFKSEESELDLVVRPAEQLRRGWGVQPEMNKPHFAVIETARLTDGGKFSFKIGSEYEGAAVGRFRVSVTDSEYPEVPPSSITPAYLATHPRERRVANEVVLKLQAERKAIENKIPTTMVMSEMATPRDTFVLARGAYDKPTDKVTPSVPAFLPPLPPDAPRNRLTLAKWVVDPANPLPARVAVNRYWQMYFGTGLVKTAEDFGAQGEAPSHPELLDWLATEFIRTGWDVKAMQKLIVMSATYRQASAASPELRERDPENRLLARGPRTRLTAEMIRDQALSVAGLLNPKMGGVPVKPYQPEGLWEQLSAFPGRKLYERSKGDDLWRRSLYSYWKRTVPPPSMMVFDAPTREFCVVKRAASSTPLQALALLNDEMYIEASRKLAERMMLEGGATPQTRLAWALRLATSRPATDAEVRVLEQGLERRVQQYRSEPASAEKLLTAGEAPRAPGLDAAELAAYTTVASVIFNLDEVITRQ